MHWVERAHAPLPNFQQKATRSRDRKGKIVNKETVRAFRKLARSRARASRFSTFRHSRRRPCPTTPSCRRIGWPTTTAVESARSMRLRFERALNGPSATELQKLMGKLLQLQQFQISPMLAQYGAEPHKRKPRPGAARPRMNAAGAFHALRDMLFELHAQATVSSPSRPHTLAS